MNKINFENNEKLEDAKCRTIGEIAATKDISYLEAEEIYNNDLKAYAISELAKSMDITYEQAEKYHDIMTANVKLMMIKENLEIVHKGLQSLLEKIS